MPKEDRRIRRTRRQLADALTQLILEKGYAQITVQDITDQADLSRATFYLHYKDKEELLIAVLSEKYDILLKQIEEDTDNLMAANRDLPIVMTFKHVHEHKDLYSALLTESETGVLYLSQIQHLRRIVEQQIQMIMPTDKSPRVPIGLIVRHHAGALFALIMWWLEQDTMYSPEQMADIFSQLTRLNDD